MTIDDVTLAAQEASFARAVVDRDVSHVHQLYHLDVVYLSPTVRLFGWPARIEGVERTLEFIALTVANVHEVSYRAVELAGIEGGQAAFARAYFDFTRERRRLRSSYVVIDRHRDGLIVQQELNYDPSGVLETLG